MRSVTVCRSPGIFRDNSESTSGSLRRHDDSRNFVPMKKIKVPTTNDIGITISGKPKNS